MSIKKVSKGTSADQLNDWIDNAAKGTRFEFAAGEYRFDDAISVRRSDISLVGAGAEKTTFKFTGKALDRNDDHAIRIEPRTTDELIGRVTSDIDQGNTTLRLSSTDGLSRGDTLRIWQDNDSAFFKEIGDTSWRKQKYAELRTSMATVKDIDGNKVTLDRGAHFDFDGNKAKVERIESIDDVTLKGIGIEFDLGTPDADAFRNTKGGLTGYEAVSIDGTVDARLEDVSVTNGPSTAFHIERSLDIAVKDTRAEGTFNKGTGGNGYAHELKESYDGTFSGLEDSGMRHGLLFASWRSSVGNDIEVEKTDRDINFHGGRDHDNQVRVLQSIRDGDSDGLSPSLWINRGGESFGAITDADANQVRFDYVIGTRRNDELQGSDDGAYLNGGLGHDVLLGGKGDDILQSGLGNDWYDGNDVLDGGAGTDIARYAQDYDRHDIDFIGDKVRIRSDKGSDDTLINMEYAIFGDGKTLDIASRRVTDGDTLDLPSTRDILSDAASNGATSSGRVNDDTELAVRGNTVSRWKDGYVKELFIENVSDEAIEGAELHLDLPDDIHTLWNGIASKDGDGYRLTDDHPQTLDPGETWRFAYKAYGDGKGHASLDATSDAGKLDVEVLGVDSGNLVELFA